IAIFRKRFPFGEFVRQCAFMANVAAAPTLLVAIPIGVIVSIQVGAVAGQVGATSFIGAANGLGIVQQGAPLVTSIMIAGAVGSAICADLGSRTIREEIDAMKVMGVDPMRRLVAPRLGAAIDRKSTRLNSSHVKRSYAVFCLKKKKNVREGVDIG